MYNADVKLMGVRTLQTISVILEGKRTSIQLLAAIILINQK